MTASPEPLPSRERESKYAPTGWDNQPTGATAPNGQVPDATVTPSAFGTPEVPQAPAVVRWEQPPMVLAPIGVGRQERNVAMRCHWLPMAMSAFGLVGALMMRSGPAQTHEFTREHARQSLNLHLTNVVVFVTMVSAFVFQAPGSLAVLAFFAWLGWAMASFIAQIAGLVAATQGTAQRLPGIPFVPRRKT